MSTQTSSKNKYPDPDIILKDVKIMWARTLKDNPYPASSGVKKDGKPFKTPPRWSFTAELTKAQYEAVKQKEAYVKSKVDPDTKETLYFMDITKNVRNSEGELARPFFIVDATSGDALTDEMANGTRADLELYLSKDISDSSGARKAYLKRMVVTDLIAWSTADGAGGASVSGPDITETAATSPSSETRAATQGKRKVSSSQDDIADEVPF